MGLWVVALVAWLIIGLIGYLHYGETEYTMTFIYWLLLWPGMIYLTVWENREQINLWLDGNGFDDWCKEKKTAWKKFFKMRVK